MRFEMKGRTFNPIVFAGKVWSETKFKYKHYIDDRTVLSFRYYGTVSDSRFKIVPVKSGKIWFTPIAEGTISAAKDSVNVKIKSTGVVVFFSIICALALLMQLLTMFAVSDYSFGRFYLIFLLAAALTVLNVLNRNKKKELKKMLEQDISGAFEDVSE